MPGMKLDFLKNPSQRVATGKSLPLKQVEAILLYGKPDIKNKVIQKVLPSTYALSLNSSTHHLLLTLLDHSDNLVRVQMLYHIRRKILDLCTSPAGNVVLQRLIEKVPGRQRKEVASVFTLSAEEDAFRQLCGHPFGNHVAQQLLNYGECVEVLKPVLVPHLGALAVHPLGMRVVAKYVAAVADGWVEVLRALVPTLPWETLAHGEDNDDDSANRALGVANEHASNALDAGLQRLFGADGESMVGPALFRHVRVPTPVKDAICAHLCAFAADYLSPAAAPGKGALAADEEAFALPDFGTSQGPRSASSTSKGESGAAGRHTHAFVAVFTHGDAAQRAELWASVVAVDGLPQALVARRGTVAVAVAALRAHEPSRTPLWQALFHRPRENDAKEGKKEKETIWTVAELARDPVRSVVLRAFVDVEPGRLTKDERRQLCEQSLELSQSPVSSPVLQHLIEVDGPEGETSSAVYAAIRSDIASLINHSSASYLLQSLLQFAPQDLRETMIREDLLPIFMENLRETLAHAQGSRVMQKLLAYATDEVIVQVVKRLISDMEAEPTVEDAESTAHEADKDEEIQRKRLSPKSQRALNRSRHYDIQSSAIISYALHQHACYVVRSLLQETRSRRLDQERKLLMNELKPHVFSLAVSPWAGRVVLDAMMEAGSELLSKAIKNVVFMKAEAWLSEVSEERKKRGNTADPTVRAVLQEQRKRTREGDDMATEAKSEQSAPKKKSRQIHRTYKK